MSSARTSRPAGGGMSTTIRSPSRGLVAGPLAPAFDRAPVPRRSASPPGCATARAAAATRTSRRGASAGAISSCVVMARRRRPARTRALSRLTLVPRRRLGRRDRQRAPILAPQHPRQHERADGHRRIGDVERPEANVANADVDEVDDALRPMKAVDQVARRAAPGKAEREDANRVARPACVWYSRHRMTSAMTANAPKM